MADYLRQKHYIFICPSYFQERIWLEEPNDCPTSWKFYPQHYKPQLTVVEMEEAMGKLINLVELELVDAFLGDGTAPTTVSFTEQNEDVISATT